MVEGQTALPQARKYVGADVIRDLNRGLFSVLDRENAVVGLYRRDLQRTYMRLLDWNPSLESLAQHRPSPA
jgi:hypothetical protein